MNAPIHWPADGPSTLFLSKKKIVVFNVSKRHLTPQKKENYRLNLVLVKSFVVTYWVLPSFFFFGAVAHWKKNGIQFAPVSFFVVYWVLTSFFLINSDETPKSLEKKVWFVTISFFVFFLLFINSIMLIKMYFEIPLRLLGFT